MCIRDRFDTLRRHQATKRIMRLRQMGMHMLQDLICGMRARYRQYLWMGAPNDALLRPQTPGHDDLAIFRQRFTDGIKRFLNSRIDKATGIDNKKVSAFIRGRNEIALSTQFGENLVL